MHAAGYHLQHPQLPQQAVQEATTYANYQVQLPGKVVLAAAVAPFDAGQSEVLQLQAITKPRTEITDLSADVSPGAGTVEAAHQAQSGLMKQQPVSIPATVKSSGAAGGTADAEIPRSSNLQEVPPNCLPQELHDVGVAAAAARYRDPLTDQSLDQLLGQTRAL